jgi:hypothetical protein
VLTGNVHHSLQQEIVREETERKGHKIRNFWNIRRRVTGKLLLLFFLNIETAGNMIYTTKNSYKTRNSKLSLLTKSKIIYRNARGVKRTSIPRVAAHADRDA